MSNSTGTKDKKFLSNKEKSERTTKSYIAYIRTGFRKLIQCILWWFIGSMFIVSIKERSVAEAIDSIFPSDLKSSPYAKPKSDSYFGYGMPYNWTATNRTDDDVSMYLKDASIAKSGLWNRMTAPPYMKLMGHWIGNTTMNSQAATRGGIVSILKLMSKHVSSDDGKDGKLSQVILMFIAPWFHIIAGFIIPIYAGLMGLKSQFTHDNYGVLWFLVFYWIAMTIAGLNASLIGMEYMFVMMFGPLLLGGKAGRARLLETLGKTSHAMGTMFLLLCTFAAFGHAGTDEELDTSAKWTVFLGGSGAVLYSLFTQLKPTEPVK